MRQDERIGALNELDFLERQGNTVLLRFLPVNDTERLPARSWSGVSGGRSTTNAGASARGKA